MAVIFTVDIAGYGLCHGVAGNAYGFLALFKATKDVKYVYRAWKVRYIL